MNKTFTPHGWIAAAAALVLAGCASGVKLDEAPVESRTPTAVGGAAPGSSSSAGASASDAEAGCGGRGGSAGSAKAASARVNASARGAPGRRIRFMKMRMRYRTALFLAGSITNPPA